MMTREEFITILFRIRNAAEIQREDQNDLIFGDVAHARWSHDAIEWAYGLGIISPDRSGNFRPADPLTRAEMAAMLVNLEGWTETAEARYSDIGGHPNAQDILLATTAGIFSGYPAGTFRPDGGVNRYEAVTVITRYLLGGKPTAEMWEDADLAFVDVSSNFWAYRYLALAVTGLSFEMP